MREVIAIFSLYQVDPLRGRRRSNRNQDKYEILIFLGGIFFRPLSITCLLFRGGVGGVGFSLQDFFRNSYRLSLMGDQHYFSLPGGFTDIY